MKHSDFLVKILVQIFRHNYFHPVQCFSVAILASAVQGPQDLYYRSQEVGPIALGELPSAPNGSPDPQCTLHCLKH
jgi:hypothetical protein